MQKEISKITPTCDLVNLAKKVNEIIDIVNNDKSVKKSIKYLKKYLNGMKKSEDGVTFTFNYNELNYHIKNLIKENEKCKKK